MAYRLGVDVGGTFTDATLINEATGQLFIDKVPSTPRDPSVGFLEAVDRILRKNGVTSREVTYLVHGTTVATNAIIEGKMARTAFITTDGFRDMLSIARQTRSSLYDLQFEKPKPLVPRYLCFGVPERMDARGRVVEPLDEGAVRTVAARLREESVESVSVCLLHAHVNPQHEARVGEILREELTETVISLSSEVAPEFREYFRASTTTINAAIRPVVAQYLHNIDDRLRTLGFDGELLVMQSNGGVQTFESASERPVFMVESGPAAGVVASTYLGNAIGRKDVISLDIGGTTAKVGLILDGSPTVSKDYEVGAVAKVGVGAARGSGYPIRTPVIDLIEIGAGGGSIAWVDSGGGLRVGPQSAGADPGPACYGWGGVLPTITDANLVLGRLNPHYFLGGEIELSTDRAHAAIKEKCADRLGLDVVETAYGIVEIANAAMVSALRLISVQRGYDPRNLVLTAFGGAGPVHGNRLAMELAIPTIVVPPSPGIFSALGLLVTDLKHDFSHTMIRRVDRLDPAALEDVAGELQDAGRAMLEREGLSPFDMAFQRHVEMRYVGQSYELVLALPAHRITTADLANIVKRFDDEHERVYGFSVPGEPTEIVNLRVTALGSINRPTLREIGAGNSAAAQKATRPVYFMESRGYVDCPIYDRYGFGRDAHVVGPAIVEEIDSTTVIHPGYAADVDRFGNLLIARQDS